MIKVDHKTGLVTLAGDADGLVDEIGVAMAAFLEQCVRADEDIYQKYGMKLISRLASCLGYIEHKFDTKLEVPDTEEDEDESSYRVKFKKSRKPKKEEED